MGYRTISFDFIPKNKKHLFATQILRMMPQFKQTLIGLTWVSRHFLELYNVNRTWGVQKIRKLVGNANNCDDIVMNYIVSHFYHELHPIQLDYEDVTIDTSIK